MARRPTVLSAAARAEVENLRETQAALTRVAEQLSGPQRGLLQRGILRLLRYMSAIVQVDTGRLKNSLHPFVEDREADIKTNVIYALPLEYMAGGRYSYIRRTATQEGPAVARDLVVQLGEDISGAFSS